MSRHRFLIIGDWFRIFYQAACPLDEHISASPDGALEQFTSVNVCDSEDFVSQFMIGECELGTDILWDSPVAMGDMNCQENRDDPRRGHDLELLAHGFRPCTSSDECASEAL